MHAHPPKVRMAHVEARIARVEGALDQINERLGSIDRRLDGVDSRFNWVIGTIIGAWITMISTQVATTLTILFHR
jgi:tetrahydromethanopterin S-methyltransferase subunit G